MSERTPRPTDPGSSRPGRSPMPSRSVRGPARSAPDVIAAVCPFLVAADGAWRAAIPAREHRCGATEPPGRLPMDKQQALCLTAAHLDCPLFEAAAGLTTGTHLAEAARAAAELEPNAVPAPPGEARSNDHASESAAPAFVDQRPVPRTTPVILDRARPPVDVRLPQLRLPGMPSRDAMDDGHAIADGGPQTRLAELRAARDRARMASAASGQADVETIGSVDGGDPRASMQTRGGAPARTRPERSMADAAARANPAEFHDDVDALHASTRADVDWPGSAGRGVGSGRQSSTPRSGRVARSGGGGFRTMGRIGGPSGGTAGIRAAIAGREIQAALAGLLALALVLVIVVRLPDGAAGVAGSTSSPDPSSTPGATVRPGTSAAAPGTTVPGASGVATPGASSDATAPPGSAVPATPAPTPRPTVAPTKTAAPTTYRVRSGDTLSAIAAEYGTTVAILMSLNNITDPRTLQVGQVLQLP